MPKEKSRWDKETQSWIHPDTVFPPPRVPAKKKRCRPRDDQREDESLETEPDPRDRRYQAAISAINRQHDEWLAEQEQLFGAVYSRDSEDELVISMSERFAELFLKAKEAGDVVLYPKGDPRGFVASTDPNQNFGWRDTDAAGKYGAAVPEIPVPNSEDAVDPARSL
jgi:hypothetical protein